MLGAIPLPFRLPGKRRWRTLRRLLCPMTAPPGTWRARPNPAGDLPRMAVAPFPAQHAPRHASAPVRGGAGRSASPAAAARDRTGARGSPAPARTIACGDRRDHQACAGARMSNPAPRPGLRADPAQRTTVVAELPGGQRLHTGAVVTVERSDRARAAGGYRVGRPAGLQHRRAAARLPADQHQARPRPAGIYEGPSHLYKRRPEG